MPPSQSQATATGYAQTCPECGATLQPVALDPDTPPWLCPISKLGWWVAELEAPMRASWQSRTRSFDFRVLGSLKAKIDQERASAATLGTSVRVDQLPRLDLTTLQAIATTLESKSPPPYTPPPSTLDPNPQPILPTGPLVTFLAQVNAAITARTVA